MQVLDRLRRRYLKEMFVPSLLGIFINPAYLIRRGLHRAVAQSTGYLGGSLLDFGCGSAPYRHLFDVREYIGLDVEQSGHPHENDAVDVYYDGLTIPFPDERFDSVFSSEAFEHIFNLERILGELHRVLKPGGHLLVTLPFVWEEHEVPYDFARYTSFGISHLLETAGFEVVSSTKTTSYVETIFQMWNIYVNKTILPRLSSNRILRVMLTAAFIAPATIAGIVLSKMLPANSDWYHNNVVLARKP